MTGNELANMYEFSYGAIKRNLDGVTNEESLVQPPGAGNCLNWVLGHIVVARNTILTLAGVTPMVGDDVAAHYRRGSEPLQPGDKVPDLDTLRGLLRDAQYQLVPVLAALSDDALAQPVPEQLRQPPLTGSVADALIRLHYHEGYHNGQIGLLRRLVGKEGAIK
ncbi:MAG: DinB family protein [Terriglobales bacterium]